MKKTHWLKVEMTCWQVRMAAGKLTVPIPVWVAARFHNLNDEEEGLTGLVAGEPVVAKDGDWIVTDGADVMLVKRTDFERVFSVIEAGAPPTAEPTVPTSGGPRV